MTLVSRKKWCRVKSPDQRLCHAVVLLVSISPAKNGNAPYYIYILCKEQDCFSGGSGFAVIPFQAFFLMHPVFLL